MVFSLSPRAWRREHTEKRLEKYSEPKTDFFILITLATIIVILGLIMNNAAIVIGGMLVAPIITPIFGFSLSLLLFRAKRIGQSLLTLLIGVVLAIAVSYLITLLMQFIEGQALSITDEILVRTKPNLAFFFVAFATGLAGAYAYAKPNVLETITGVAISVAILPPLCVVGFALAAQNMNLAESSSLLFFFNLIGIMFGSVIMFLALGFSKDASFNIQ